ncbi:MAG: response regulator transcription factor [Aeromicrobium sp.]
MSPRLLLVEDDDQIAAPLIRTLEREDYQVERVAAGLPAIERVKAGDIDLVLLDLGLPDLDGLDVCRRLRASSYEGGIMILTARGGELDRVVGLDVGADDYLAKPFSLAEMLARVRALLRRSAAAGLPATDSTPLAEEASEDIVRIDAHARRAWVGSTEIALTAKEFDVIALLASEPGAVLTRERVMDEVWDENWFGSTKTLDATLGRLRQKLEDSGTRSQIVTVRGVGFRLEIDPSRG